MSASLAKLMGADQQLRIDWEQLDPWTKNQLETVLQYCQQHGWQLKNVSEQQSRTLDSILGVWQITFESHNKLKTAWVISGDLPTEIISFNNIPTARDALLHFSRKYLNKAQLMKRHSFDTDEQRELSEQDQLKMQKLVKAAADLLVLYHEDNVWNDKQ
ncbi:MAG: DUF4826 family protein [Kangiellaceae bacterium]|jgi:hypothetical protein|nr:DUF4826 family protein [Kangiellaceae bacterium]